MAIDHKPRENDGPSTLILRLPLTTQPVSLLSSLLRTLQAAVRESALATPLGAQRLVEPPAPVLLASIRGPGGEDGLELRFFFAGPASSRPELELSETAFAAFMDTLEQTLKAQPQRMLWDVPSRPPRGAGPGKGPSPRIRQMWDDLGRFRNATLSVGARQITVSDGSVEITGS